MNEKTIVTDIHNLDKEVEQYQRRDTFQIYDLPESILDILNRKRITHPTLFQCTVLECAFESNKYDIVIQHSKREWIIFVLGISISTIVHDLKKTNKNVASAKLPYAIVLFHDIETCKSKSRNFLTGDLKAITVISTNLCNFYADIIFTTFDIMEELLSSGKFKKGNIQLVVVDCNDNFVDFDGEKVSKILNLIDPEKIMMRIFYATRFFSNHTDQLVKCLRQNVRLIRTQIISKQFSTSVGNKKEGVLRRSRSFVRSDKSDTVRNSPTLKHRAQQSQINKPLNVPKPLLTPISRERRVFLQRKLSFGVNDQTTQQQKKTQMKRSQSVKPKKTATYTRGLKMNNDEYTTDDCTD